MSAPKKNAGIGPTISTPLPKIATHIEGLDRILNGGIPAERVTLISGGPGTGKSMIGLEFLYRSAASGHPCIFLTFEETRKCVIRNALTMGWDLEALETNGMLFIMESRIDPDPQISGEFNLEALRAVLEGKMRAMKAERIVIDALDMIMRVFEDESRRQNEFFALNKWLKERKITAILTIKNSKNKKFANYSFLDFMADCVIALDHRILKQVTTKKLLVTKYRGSDYLENEHPFFIATGGIHFHPVADMDMHYASEGKRISSGHPYLDAILDGGYKTGTCILVSGSTGTGKTTIASMFANSVCGQKQKVLYINYEEAQKSMVSGMLSLGIDLRPALDNSLLRIMAVMPESMGIEKHLFVVTHAIKQHNPRHLVIDAISASKRIAGKAAAFDFIMRIVDACKRAGITAFLVNQSETLADFSDFSGMGVSSIVDTIINLEYQDTGTELRRRMMVIKSRGANHSHRYHEYQLTGQGLRIPADPGKPHEDKK
jgi:circadian clock protein KaiC